MHERIHAELAALPGVRAVGATSALPLTASANQTTVQFPSAPGNTGDSDHDGPLIDYTRVLPGSFEALGIPILQGRAFQPEAPGETLSANLGETRNE